MYKFSAMWLTDPEISDSWNLENVGGKAHQLHRLAVRGYPVPRFGVLTTASYKHWLRTGVLDPGSCAQMNAALEGWKDDFYAVRSSINLEDGSQSSFAGIFDTFLYVKPSDVLKRVIDCYQSISSDRAKAYLAQKKISEPSLNVSVIVQKMLHSRTSGVAFSRALTLNSTWVYIEAGLGLGEGIVSGKVEVDRYWVDRFGKTARIKIADKSNQMVFVPENQRVELTSPRDDQKKKSCLENDRILELARKTLSIEKDFARPVDVEWAVDRDDRLHILQARPITRSFAPVDFFTDINLCESYPGLTSPATATFIPALYEKVLSEAVTLLGCSDEEFQQLRPTFSTLIRSFQGHLYYYLNSYYTLLGFFPGGKKNVAAWHRMIGGQEVEVPYHDVTASRLTRLRQAVSLIWIWLNHDRIYSRFIDASSALLAQHEALLASSRSSVQTAKTLTRLIHDTRDWGLTSLNDFFIILGLKGLSRLLASNGCDPAALSQLLKTGTALDSMNALGAVEILSAALKENPAFYRGMEEFVSTAGKSPRWPDVELWLEEKGFSKERLLIQDFLKHYGERSFEELKLESMPFSQDPPGFFQLLFLIGDTDLSSRTSGAKSAPPLDTSHWKLHDRIRLEWIQFWTAKAVGARESTRLMRGRYFGLLRRGILQIGNSLKKEYPDRFSALEERDFFLITHDDIRGFAAGRISAADLHCRMVRRKKEWPARALDYPEVFCHSAQDSQDPFAGVLKPDSASENPAGSKLQGLGASEGEITGTARIVRDPREVLGAEDFSKCILVTRTTDPAWIFLMSRCLGLVSEKGSLLSHTAIVGRELGLPTVVGLPHATRLIKDGKKIKINGKTGLVTLEAE